MALVVLHQDTFDRANEALGASPMSDGLGTWTADTGTLTVASNLVTNPGGSAENVYYDSAMADTADHQTTLTTKNALTGEGAVARRNATSKYYLSHNNGGNHQLYKNNSGFTQLGSTGAALAINDTHGVGCVGTAISAYKNGALDIGPITDSTHATGKAGIRMFNGGTTADNWQVEVEGAAAVTVFNFIGNLFGRFLSLGGM